MLWRLAFYGGLAFAAWWLWHDYRDGLIEQGRMLGRAEIIAEAKRAQERADAIANAKFADLARQAESNRERADEMLRLEVAESARQLAALKGSLPAYVAPLQLSRCNDLPRGFLRYASDAAAFANGQGALGPGAGPDPHEPPSGVSLAAYADTVAEQAGAYRACRERVEGWKRYADDLKGWCASVVETLTGPD